MTVDQDTRTVDQDALLEFLGRFVGDLGATMAAGNIVIGYRLGLYSALAVAPATPEQLATRTGTTAAVRDRVAGRSGGRRLRQLRRPNRHVLADAGAGIRAGRAGRSQLAGGVLDRGRSAAGRAAHHRRHSGPALASAGMSTTRTCSPAREAFFRPLYVANLVSNWIPALDGVDAKLTGRRAGRRRWLRPRRLYRPAGPGLPGRDDRRIGLSPRVHRHRPHSSRHGRRRGPHIVRGEFRPDLHRLRIRPGGDVRLPARHGRPPRGGSSYSRGARSRRHLAHRRALRRRRGIGQPQSAGTHVLLGLELPVRAERTFPTRRILARRPGRRAPHPPGGHRRWLHPVPPSRGDPVQPRSTRSDGSRADRATSKEPASCWAQALASI